MVMWKEEEDLEEHVELGEHWPIERGLYPMANVWSNS